MVLDERATASVLRSIEGLDISDLTSSVVTGPPVVTYDENGIGISLTIPFDVEPTAEEQRRILVRMLTATANEETVANNAFLAMDDNRAWVGNILPQIETGADAIIADPTATVREKQLAQALKAVAIQTGDLCRQNNALIRVALHQYDGTD